jgi:hypothetical protein
VTSKISLNCDPKTKVVIIKATYGREKYSATCDTSYYDGTCEADSEYVKDILNDLCLNNQTCSISVDLDKFNDPCPNVTKSLKIWYQCIGEGMFLKFF